MTETQMSQDVAADLRRLDATPGDAPDALHDKDQRMQSPAKLAEDAWFDDGGKVSLRPKPPAMGVTGALAAALVDFLRHSRIEDETLGATSDRLFSETLGVSCEERDKPLLEDLRDEPLNEPMNDA